MLNLLGTLYQSLTPLWEMSVTAAYASAIIIVLRLLLKKRAPKQVLCLLWLVVFARLLIPVSLESPLSIVPGALPGQEQQLQLPGQIPGSPETGNPGAPQSPVQENTPGQAVGGGAIPVMGSPAEPSLTAPAGVTPSAPSPESPAPFPWQSIVAGVWLAGAVAMGAYALLSYFRLRRRLFDAIRAKDGAWEHPDIDSPFILGMLRPRIYLPAGLVGQPRKFILCHERAHLRRLDHIVKPVCWIALALHWFNPLVWAAYILMSRDIESACDEAVVRRLGIGVKADYSTTLLALATGRRAPSPCPLAFDEGDAKGRIQNVLRYRRPALWVIVVSAVMAVMAAVCLLTDPVAAKGPEGDPDPGVTASQAPAPDTGLNALLDPWMKELLDGEREFRSSYNEAQEFTIHQMSTFYYGEPVNMTVKPGKLAIIDLDRDGVNEMVIYPVREPTDDPEEIVYQVGYLILRRQGDEVYGSAPGWRSFSHLKADGTFTFSSGASDWGIMTARFPEGRLDLSQDDLITWCEGGGSEEQYFVDGLKATQEEFDAAASAHSAKPDVAWFTYENGVLSPCLPDNLELLGQTELASNTGEAKLWLEGGETPWLEWNGATSRLSRPITPEEFGNILCRDFDGDGQNEVVIGRFINHFLQIDLYEWVDGTPVPADSYDTQQLLLRFNKGNVAAYNKDTRGLTVTYSHTEGDPDSEDYYRHLVSGYAILPEGFFDGGYEHIRDGYTHVYANQFHLLYLNSNTNEYYFDFEFYLADETMQELNYVDTLLAEPPYSQYADHYMIDKPVGVTGFTLRYDGTDWRVQEADALAMDYQDDQAPFSTMSVLANLDYTLITSLQDIPDDPEHWSLVAELPDDMIWLFTRNYGSEVLMRWDGNFHRPFVHTAYTPWGIMPVMKKIGPDDNTHYGPIAVISNVGSGTGVAVDELVVYDLDAYPAAVDYVHDWAPLRDSFNSNCSYQYDQNTQTITCTYRGKTAELIIDGGDEMLRRIEAEGISLTVTGNIVHYYFNEDGSIQVEFPLQAFIGSDVIDAPLVWPWYLRWTIRFNGSGFDTVPGSCELFTYAGQ